MALTKEQLDQVEFKGEKRFLSNMYPCKIHFKEQYGVRELEHFPSDNKVYNSTEHIYQAMKSDNEIWQELILSQERPESTKTLARKKIKTLTSNEKDTFLQKENWHDTKYDLMKRIVFLKFEQNKDLREKLCAIEGQIEERNYWGDTYWGTVNGIGENNLGKILMEVRDFFKNKR